MKMKYTFENFILTFLISFYELFSEVDGGG